ncbi:hypothetical protein [Flavobacterium piscinae]|uniref:hypothetical protein n=1 Tax=Flavobacterium piscinae TaxID=2506424 RepID=UPI002AAB2FB6|nr:hypothetical protein [Flavobacterium piscinae]
MNSGYLLVILLLYLGLLFFIAQWAERKGSSKWTNNPYVYSLSLAVYCTTWTYYGSIGVAANSGLNFIPIYLGPVIAFPAWILILRKIIRISRVNKISSIADFISFVMEIAVFGCISNNHFVNSHFALCRFTT